MTDPTPEVQAATTSENTAHKLTGEAVTLAANMMQEQYDIHKQNAAALIDEKNNKIRMVEINTYERDRNYAYIKIMKYIVLFCTILSLIIVVTSQFNINERAVNIVLTLIVAVGLIVIGINVGDIISRDNMVYSKYNWEFDPSSMAQAPSTTIDGLGDKGGLLDCCGPHVKIVKNKSNEREECVPLEFNIDENPNYEFVGQINPCPAM